MDTDQSAWLDVARTMPFMLAGLRYTAIISIASMAIAMVLGLAVTSLRLGKNRLMSGLGFVYVQLFRSFSTYVYILFIYFGVSAFFRFDIEPVTAAIIALSLMNSAYMAEIYRSAIVNVDPGTVEAAVCIGLTRRQTFFDVVFPQAIRLAFPSLLNQFIVILRDSSIVGVIGVADIMFVASKAAAVKYQQFEYYSAVAVIFIVLVFVISRLGDLVEKRLALP